MDPPPAETITILCLPLLAAPFIGSLLGVLIIRLPAGRPVVMARSECDHCGHRLNATELVPLLSYLWLRGRCRSCARPIAGFHPAVELAALAVAAVAVAAGGGTASIWVNCALGWVLLALAWIDVRHLLLPDVLTLPLCVAGLCVTWVLAPADTSGHALGAIAGYAGFRAIELTYRLLRGRAGLGQGDAKLLAAGGAWVGVAALPLVVFGAALLGIVITLLLAPRRGLAARVPFGPALALALFLVRLFPQLAAPLTG